MPFRISGKQIDLGEALRERIRARLAEILAKYFDGGYSGHVTVGKEGHGFRTECAIHLDSGITLQSDASAGDAYASADAAALRIEKRLRRYNRRLKDRHMARSQPGGLAAPDIVIAAPEESGEELCDFSPTIIAESKTTLRRLSVSDAVMELDMTGAPVIVFWHATHGRVNIVYRRSDGHIGWIDPPHSGAEAH